LAVIHEFQTNEDSACCVVEEVGLRQSCSVQTIAMQPPSGLSIRLFWRNFLANNHLVPLFVSRVTPKSSPLPPVAGVSFDAATGVLNTTGADVDKLASSSEMNSHALEILNNSGIPVLGQLSYNMSVALAEQHVGSQASGWSTLDCLHHCQGGIPQVQRCSTNLFWWHIIYHYLALTKELHSCVRCLDFNVFRARACV
jgi:hypothetical protein